MDAEIRLRVDQKFKDKLEEKAKKEGHSNLSSYIRVTLKKDLDK